MQKYKDTTHQKKRVNCEKLAELLFLLVKVFLLKAIISKLFSLLFTHFIFIVFIICKNVHIILVQHCSVEKRSPASLPENKRSHWPLSCTRWLLVISGSQTLLSSIEASTQQLLGKGEGKQRARKCAFLVVFHHVEKLWSLYVKIPSKLTKNQYHDALALKGLWAYFAWSANLLTNLVSARGQM